MTTDPTAESELDRWFPRPPPEPQAEPPPDDGVIAGVERPGKRRRRYGRRWYEIRKVVDLGIDTDG